MSSANTPTIGPLDPRDASPLPLEPGDVVAQRYEVLRLLGSGGSAHVYAVYDRRIGDEIALKLLRDDVDVARSRREAEFARGSSSERLVRAFDLVEAGGFVFLTMELVPGGSLRDRLRRQPLPIDEAVRLAGEILEALAGLHALGIVHRDLKPGNLLLTADGHVKLSDFGIARRWTDEESRLTVTGATLGTIDYLSPEQALGEDAGPRSDLYSFGVVLYEMLTGRLPFEAPTKAAAIGMRLQRRPAGVRTLRPDTPRWLAAVVARLLQRKPEDRYPDAQTVLGDLRRRKVGVARPRLRIAALLAVLVLLAGLGWLRSLGAVRLVADGTWGARGIGAFGNVEWRRSDLLPKHAAFVRRRGGRLLAAVLTPGRHGPSPPVLSFLDPRTGRVVRSVRLPWAGDRFPGYSDRYVVHEVRATDFDRDGTEEVLVAYGHVNNYYPWFVVLHDLRTGESRIVFVASGQHRITGIADVDGDDRPELIVNGTANRLGWYFAVGAVRVRLDRPEATAYTPDRDDPSSRGLAWYALCPHGTLDSAAVTVDESARKIRMPYDLNPVDVSFEGFVADASRSSAGRSRARERAYHHLRRARRSIRGGDGAAAVKEADAARQQALLAGDATLAEWIERVRGMALAHAGRAAEADVAFDVLCKRPEAAGDAAYDAGTAFHLAGDLPRAVAWYRRGLGTEGEPRVGRVRYETLQGLVFALGEMGQWDVALRDLDASVALDSAYEGMAARYRDYVAWRTGSPRAAYDPAEHVDPYRYIGLESELAADAGGRATLRKLDGELRIASETRNVLLATKAEALRRAGDRAAALQVARDAYRRLLANRRTSVFDRAHLDLAAGRYAQIAGENGLPEEARRVRAEAAALRWHSNRMSR